MLFVDFEDRDGLDTALKVVDRLVRPSEYGYSLPVGLLVYAENPRKSYTIRDIVLDRLTSSDLYVRSDQRRITTYEIGSDDVFSEVRFSYLNVTNPEIAIRGCIVSDILVDADPGITHDKITDEFIDCVIPSLLKTGAGVTSYSEFVTKFIRPHQRRKGHI